MSQKRILWIAIDHYNKSFSVADPHHLRMSKLSAAFRKEIERAEKSNFFLPNAFFNVRTEVSAKARRSVMYSYATLIYSVVVIVFSIIFYYQSKVTTTETSIQKSDISDGVWSCEMVSVVSKSISTIGSSAPLELSQGYNLISVSEVGSECQAELKATDPCADGTITTQGSGPNPNCANLQLVASSKVFQGGMTYIATSGESTGPLCFATANPAGLFNISSGVITTFPAVGELSQAAVVDVNGQGYFLTLSKVILNTDGATVYEAPVSDGGDVIIVLFNDNLFNIYYAYNRCEPWMAGTCNAIYQLRLTSNGDSFTASAVTSVAEFSSTFLPNSCTGYTDANTDVFVTYCVMSNQTLVSIPTDTQQVTVLMSFDVSSYWTVSDIDATGLYLLLTDSTSVYKFMLDDNTLSAPLFSVESSVFLNTLAIYDDSLVVGTNFFWATYSMTQEGSTYEVMQQGGYNGAATQWFTCGATVLNRTYDASVSTSQYCDANGLAWATTLSSERFLTPSGFATYINALHAQYCTSQLYTEICATVGNLPPYLCTKQVHPSTLAVLSTAIANSHLLFLILVAVASLVMKAGQRRINDLHHTSGASEPQPPQEMQLPPSQQVWIFFAILCYKLYVKVYICLFLSLSFFPLFFLSFFLKNVESHENGVS